MFVLGANVAVAVGAATGFGALLAGGFSIIPDSGPVDWGKVGPQMLVGAAAGAAGGAGGLAIGVNNAWAEKEPGEAADPWGSFQSGFLSGAKGPRTSMHSAG